MGLKYLSKLIIMKTTAIAPSNIAFVKFFGKKDEQLRLPANSSISMCLSEAFTQTTVEFSSALKQDDVSLIDGQFSDQEKKRIVGHIDRIRKLAKLKIYCKIVTHNSFPKSTGIASSASGFAALTLAVTAAAGLQLSNKELSILARLASGSACRSIPDGFVEWLEGETSESSYAYSLYPPSYWDIRDIVAVVEERQKKVTTTDAHKIAVTSPFFKARMREIKEKISRLKNALSQKDFAAFGEITEEEALNMHALMLTAKPPLLYFSAGTINLMKAVWSWRRERLPVYFTIDAGANVHLICEGRNEAVIAGRLKMIKEIRQIIINKPAVGARLTDDHLF